MSRHVSQYCEHEYPHLPHTEWGQPITRCPGRTVRAADREYPAAVRRDVLTRIRRVSPVRPFHDRRLVD